MDSLIAKAIDVGALIGFALTLTATPRAVVAQSEAPSFNVIVENPRAPWFRAFLRTIESANATVSARGGRDLLAALEAEERGFAVVPYRRLVAISRDASPAGQILLASEVDAGLCAVLATGPRQQIENLGDLALSRAADGGAPATRIAVEHGLDDLAWAITATYALSDAVELMTADARGVASALAAGQVELGILNATDRRVPAVDRSDAIDLRYLPLSAVAKQRLESMGLSTGSHEIPVDGTRIDMVCDDILILRPVGVALPAIQSAQREPSPPSPAGVLDMPDDAIAGTQGERPLGERLREAIAMLGNLL